MNSSASSRKKILTLLQPKNGFIQKDFANVTLQEHKSFDEGKRWSIKEKVLRLKSMMEAVHTEVHLCERETWKNNLLSVLEQKKIAQDILFTPSARILGAFPVTFRKRVELE